MISQPKALIQINDIPLLTSTLKMTNIIVFRIAGCRVGSWGDLSALTGMGSPIVSWGIFKGF